MSPPITGAYSLKKQHAVFLRLLIGIILTEQPFQLIMAYLCVFVLINHNDNFHVILWYTSQSPLIFRNAQCTYRHLRCSYLCIQLKMKLVYYTYKKKINFIACSSQFCPQQLTKYVIKFQYLNKFITFRMNSVSVQVMLIHIHQLSN